MNFHNGPIWRWLASFVSWLASRSMSWIPQVDALPPLYCCCWCWRVWCMSVLISVRPLSSVLQRPKWKLNVNERAWWRQVCRICYHICGASGIVPRKWFSLHHIMLQMLSRIGICIQNMKCHIIYFRQHSQVEIWIESLPLLWVRRPDSEATSVLGILRTDHPKQNGMSYTRIYIQETDWETVN
jgi:hypothetical protein